MNHPCMDERPAKRARLQINLDLHLVDQDSGCSITIDSGETNSSHRAIGNDEVATVDTSTSTGQQRSGIADASQQRPIASVTQSCGINVLSQNDGDTTTSRLAPAVATMEQNQAQGVNGNLVRGPNQSNRSGLLAQPNGRNDTLDNGQTAPVHANALVPSPNPWTTAAQQARSYMQRSGLRNMDQALDKLDESRLRRILLQHVNCSPYIATSVLASYEEALQTETYVRQHQRISFSHYSYQVSDAIDSRHRYRGTWEENVAKVDSEVEWVVEECIASRIKRNSNFRTKRSALETLREIAKRLFLSNSHIAWELKTESALAGNAIVLAMYEVIDRLTSKERARMAALDDGDFIHGLEELEDVAIPRKLCESFEDMKILIQDAEEETSSSSGDD